MASATRLAVEATSRCTRSRSSARGKLCTGWRATNAAFAATLACGSRATAMSVTSLTFAPAIRSTSRTALARKAGAVLLAC